MVLVYFVVVVSTCCIRSVVEFRAVVFICVVVGATSILSICNVVTSSRRVVLSVVVVEVVIVFVDSCWRAVVVLACI